MFAIILMSALCDAILSVDLISIRDFAFRLNKTVTALMINS